MLWDGVRAQGKAKRPSTAKAQGRPAAWKKQGGCFESSAYVCALFRRVKAGAGSRQRPRPCRASSDGWSDWFGEMRMRIGGRQRTLALEGECGYGG